MKKVISIIVFLLWVVAGYSVNYASPYKGAGRNGYVYSTARAQSSSSYSGFAQAPTASMHSTTSMYRGIASANTNTSATSQVRVMQTFASTVTGGVTSADTYSHIRPAKSKKSSEDGPGVPDGACTECDWVWDPELGIYVCSVCGSWSNLGCDHLDEHGYCWCPIGDGWQVWLFMAMLAIAYTSIKKTTGKVLAGR